MHLDWAPCRTGPGRIANPTNLHRVTGEEKRDYIAFRSSTAIRTMPMTETNQASVRSQAMPAT